MIVEKILCELFDPMVQVKRHTIETLRRICERKASEIAEPWRRWTVWLAFAITAKRIEGA